MIVNIQNLFIVNILIGFCCDFIAFGDSMGQQSSALQAKSIDVDKLVR